MKSKLSSLGLILVLVFSVFYLSSKTNLEEIYSVFSQADAFFLYLGFLGVLASLGLFSLRWDFIVKVLSKKRISFPAIIGMTFTGNFYGLILPSKVGPYFKAVLLKQVKDIPLKQGISAVTLELISDIIYLVTTTYLALVVLSYSAGSIDFQSVAAQTLPVTTFLLLILIFPKKAFSALVKVLTKIHFGFADKIVAVLKSVKKLFSNKKLFFKTIISTFGLNLSAVIAIYWFMLALGGNIDFLTGASIIIVSIAIGVASFLPGGWGAQDISLIILSSQVGLTVPQATGAVILFRMSNVVPLTVVTIWYHFKALKF